VCFICIGSSLITFCIAIIQLRRLGYVSFALPSKNNVPARNTYFVLCWEAGVKTARINAVLAQLLTHRIIKLHVGTALS
jgi:hypothetical protein